jgi:hypothetical protein
MAPGNCTSRTAADRLHEFIRVPAAGWGGACGGLSKGINLVYASLLLYSALSRAVWLLSTRERNQYLHGPPPLGGHFSLNQIFFIGMRDIGELC